MFSSVSSPSPPFLTFLQAYLLKLAGRDTATGGGGGLSKSRSDEERAEFERRQMRHHEAMNELLDLLQKSAASAPPQPSPLSKCGIHSSRFHLLFSSSSSSLAPPEIPLPATASVSFPTRPSSLLLPSSPLPRSQEQVDKEEEEARWAGGAFENSPDPDELPLPRFLFGSSSEVPAAPSAPTYSAIAAAEKKPKQSPSKQQPQRNGKAAKK